MPESGPLRWEGPGGTSAAREAEGDAPQAGAGYPRRARPASLRALLIFRGRWCRPPAGAPPACLEAKATRLASGTWPNAYPLQAARSMLRAEMGAPRLQSHLVAASLLASELTPPRALLALSPDLRPLRLLVPSGESALAGAPGGNPGRPLQRGAGRWSAPAGAARSKPGERAAGRRARPPCSGGHPAESAPARGPSRGAGLPGPPRGASAATWRGPAAARNGAPRGASPCAGRGYRQWRPSRETCPRPLRAAGAAPRGPVAAPPRPQGPLRGALAGARRQAHLRGSPAGLIKKTTTAKLTVTTTHYVAANQTQSARPRPGSQRRSAQQPRQAQPRCSPRPHWPLPFTCPLQPPRACRSPAAGRAAAPPPRPDTRRPSECARCLSYRPGG